MSNEEIVKQIKKNINPGDNFEYLYKKNFSFINKIIQPYIGIEDKEDLQQEAYFGLYQAVMHYEDAKEVPFINYASFWINQAVIRYINKSQLLKIPEDVRMAALNYKKCVQSLSKKLGRVPERIEILQELSISDETLQIYEKITKGIKSLNEKKVNEDGSETELIDSVICDFDVENAVIDKIHNDLIKSEIWGIIERNFNALEIDVLKNRFIECKTYKEISDICGITQSKARNIEHNSLRKMRLNKIKSEILKKTEMIPSYVYKGSLKNFLTTWDSTTEKAAINLVK